MGYGVWGSRHLRSRESRVCFLRQLLNRPPPRSLPARRCPREVKTRCERHNEFNFSGMRKIHYRYTTGPKLDPQALLPCLTARGRMSCASCVVRLAEIQTHTRTPHAHAHATRARARHTRTRTRTLLVSRLRCVALFISLQQTLTSRRRQCTLAGHPRRRRPPRRCQRPDFWRSPPLRSMRTSRWSRLLVPPRASPPPPLPPRDCPRRRPRRRPNGFRS